MAEREEAWRRHNEDFRYEPPDKHPEAWSQEEYTELYDRIIDRRVQWVCGKCTKPFGNLDRARRHVQDKHGEKLIRKAERKIEESAGGERS